MDHEDGRVDGAMTSHLVRWLSFSYESRVVWGVVCCASLSLSAGRAVVRAAGGLCARAIGAAMDRHSAAQRCREWRVRVVGSGRPRVSYGGS